MVDSKLALPSNCPATRSGGAISSSFARGILGAVEFRRRLPDSSGVMFLTFELF